eukprot:2717793-Pyramimonas_sp.AAC.2
MPEESKSDDSFRCEDDLFGLQTCGVGPTGRGFLGLRAPTVTTVTCLRFEDDPIGLQTGSAGPIRRGSRLSVPHKSFTDE